MSEYKPLTVNELLEQLLKLKQDGKGDALVLLSKDDEWNWFRTIDKSQIELIDDNTEKDGIAELMHHYVLNNIGGFKDKDVIVLG